MRKYTYNRLKKIIEELEDISNSLLDNDYKEITRIIGDLNLLLLVPTLDKRNRKMRVLVKLHHELMQEQTGV